MNSEEAFLFSTFKEFYKCWKSGTNARVFIESVNGKAFFTFSAFLGYPEDVHFKPRQWKRNPSKGPRKKSANKIKRDNDRAARFQARKRKEEEAASASKSVDTPEAIVSSSPGSESLVTISDLEFSFSTPVPENLRQDTSQSTSMILNDNIEHRKQDNTLNSSGLEFQGEEEEVQEHISSSSITDHSEIKSLESRLKDFPIPPSVCQDILRESEALLLKMHSGPFCISELAENQTAANLTVVPAPPTIHHHSTPAPMITTAASSTTIHHHTCMCTPCTIKRANECIAKSMNFMSSVIKKGN